MSRHGWVAVTLALSGCPGPSNGSVAPTAGENPEPDDTAAPPQDPAPTCAPAGARVDDYRWLPLEATVAASVDLQADGVQGAIEQLAEHARGPDPDVPIDVAFALGQWSWQVPLLRTTLASAGFAPGELAYARMKSGASAWVFVTTCSFDEASDRMERSWGLDVRRTASGAVGVAADPDGAPFAYDVVFLPANRIALVPAGGATAFEQALAVRADAVDGPPTTAVVGALLGQIEDAPIRVLVAGGVALGSGTAGPATALRVDAQGVDSGSLPAQP